MVKGLLMSKGKSKFKRPNGGKVQPNNEQRFGVQFVKSLLANMEDGREYGSIVGLMPEPGVDLVGEVLEGIREIEKIRNRPCLVYVGNVVRRDSGGSGVDATDDLPFIEMVRAVPAPVKKIDVLIATNGGSAHQISRFVNVLHSRFEEVDFLIPSFCMSAGTLFALSGNNLWMSSSACLGPIDPQVPTKEGRYVPAQALLLLVDKLQQDGQESMAKGLPIPWSAVRIIDSIDKKELGDALTASHYSTMMAAEFLFKYKFQNWSMRETSQQPVTDEYKKHRAVEIANALASHDRWKNHGHAISRSVLWDEIKLKIEHPDPALERAIVRAWALFNWIFEKSPVLKFICSSEYRYVKNEIEGGKPT